VVFITYSAAEGKTPKLARYMWEVGKSLAMTFKVQHFYFEKSLIFTSAIVSPGSC